MKKLVLFDIDGTLFRTDVRVPQSAVDAIKQCADNGNYVMLCTGRNHSMIPKEVQDLPISGEVEACGAYVAVGDRILTNAALEGEECQEIIKALYECHCPFYIENSDYFYYDEDYVPDVFASAVISMNRNYPETARHMDTFPNRIAKITGYPEDTSKLEELRERVSKWFEMIVHDEYNYIEMIYRGYTKGTGVQQVMDYLGIDKEDTYGFGDSMNDLPMLETVGHGIVMGEATSYLKEHYPSTTSMYHDGIANGLKMAGLI